MHDIVLTQEQLARRYGLSRQTAMMLAMLVCLPSVSPTMIASRLGHVDARAVVARLRARLRLADEAVVIHNTRTFGYYLDPTAQERFRDASKSTPVSL